LATHFAPQGQGRAADGISAIDLLHPPSAIHHGHGAELQAFGSVAVHGWDVYRHAAKVGRSVQLALRVNLRWEMV